MEIFLQFWGNDQRIERWMWNAQQLGGSILTEIGEEGVWKRCVDSRSMIGKGQPCTVGQVREWQNSTRWRVNEEGQLCSPNFTRRWFLARRGDRTDFACCSWTCGTISVSGVAKSIFDLYREGGGRQRFTDHDGKWVPPLNERRIGPGGLTIVITRRNWQLTYDQERAYNYLVTTVLHWRVCMHDLLIFLLSGICSIKIFFYEMQH